LRIQLIGFGVCLTETITAPSNDALEATLLPPALRSAHKHQTNKLNITASAATCRKSELGFQPKLSTPIRCRLPSYTLTKQILPQPHNLTTPTS